MNGTIGTRLQFNTHTSFIALKLVEWKFSISLLKVQSSSLQSQKFLHTVWRNLSSIFSNSHFLLSGFHSFLHRLVYLSLGWIVILAVSHFHKHQIQWTCHVHGPTVNHYHQTENIPWNGAISALVFRLVVNRDGWAEVVIPTFIIRDTIYKSNQSLTLKKTRLGLCEIYSLPTKGCQATWTKVCWLLKVSKSSSFFDLSIIQHC